MPNFAPTGLPWTDDVEPTNTSPVEAPPIQILDGLLTSLAVCRKLMVPAMWGAPLDEDFADDSFGTWTLEVRVGAGVDWITVSALATVDDSSEARAWRVRASTDSGGTWTEWASVQCDVGDGAAMAEAQWTSTTPMAIQDPLVADSPHSLPIDWAMTATTVRLEFEIGEHVSLWAVDVRPEVRDASTMDK